MTAWRSSSVDETQAIGRELALELAPDGVLLLVGGLGAGKTVLVRGLAESLGFDPEEVPSPTFTLVREHRRGDLRLLHLDLYRLSAAEVEAAGFEELLLGPGVKAVEWSERLPFDLPGAVTLEIERRGEERDIRRIRPQGIDDLRAGEE
jgi:tRNA threonylcarbamoyladenosine biosynthesis protein TsaE